MNLMARKLDPVTDCAVFTTCYSAFLSKTEQSLYQTAMLQVRMFTKTLLQKQFRMGVRRPALFSLLRK